MCLSSPTTNGGFQAQLSNIAVLRRVDDKDNRIEWITSVSMLSEGWDVKNVFQIVPHEERAFNSKLLIAQVLGRGLRIPEVYKGNQPIVTVFNHDKWSSSIKHLVDEVLEIEKRIHSYPVKKKEDYNFDLYNIDYKRTEEEDEYPQEDTYELLKKGYVAYSSQAEVVENSTTYIIAISGELDEKKTLIEFKKYSVDEAANEVVNKLQAIDMDLDTKYSEEFGREKVKKIIEESLKRIGVNGKWVSEPNLQKTLQAFGVVYRKKAKSLRFKIEGQSLIKKSTKDINKNSIGVGSLRRDNPVFWDDYSMKSGEAADQKLLIELEEDESLPRSAMIKVDNRYNFKAPLNVVLASHEPERKFIKGLVSEQNAKSIDAWIKSLDVGFYSIEYSWRKGEHPKQGSFNPDFFIRTGNDTIIVEIKIDSDVSDENKAKLRYATEHTARVNALQPEHRYYFKFLSPVSYDLFFKALREKTYKDFRSELEAKLEG
jgi:type III restriction enzyme